MPPVSACSSGLALTALVAVLLLPASYYGPGPPPSAPAPAPDPPRWPDIDLVHLPTLDLVLTAALLMLGFLLYVCEFIQRKLMERRVVKLNQYLGASVERLRAWDAQQDQLEATLKLVQHATCEYNLLLYLLLRQHRGLAPAGPPSNCFFDKDLDDRHFLRSPPPDA